MPGMQKVSAAFRDGGVGRVAHLTRLRLKKEMENAYGRTVRPRLGFLRKEPVFHAGVMVGYRLPTDRFVVPRPDLPRYEEALINCLKAHVRRGDRVLIVGSGEGVTATIASQLAGPEASVTGFEGSAEQVATSRMTLSQNGASQAKIVHGIVGAPVGVYGDTERFGQIVDPAELPDCDVLEMDCEGSEIGILERMRIRPRVVIVETHGMNGAPTGRVMDVLAKLGYTVTDAGWAEPHLLEDCQRYDIRVVQGVRQ